MGTPLVEEGTADAAPPPHQATVPPAARGRTEEEAEEVVAPPTRAASPPVAGSRTEGAPAAAILSSPVRATGVSSAQQGAEGERANTGVALEGPPERGSTPRRAVSPDAAADAADAGGAGNSPNGGESEVPSGDADAGVLAMLDPPASHR